MRQIAYVLGFGLLWDESPWQPLLQEPSVAADGSVVPGRDTHFAGPLAAAAFAAIGGAAYAGATVPVENDTAQYGSGTLDLNWRESVFGAELMTTLLDTPAPPVSKVTIASLADLGYEVDGAKAEPYALPAAAAGAADGGVQFRGGALRRAPLTVAELPPGWDPVGSR